MKSALFSSALALGISVALGGCDRTAEDRRAETRAHDPSTAEQRRSDEQKAAERRIEERQAEQRRSEARRHYGEPAIGGGPRMATPASAVASIATARCDREIRCKNVGPKEKYKTRADCTQKLRDDKHDDLNADSCPDGVSETELANCLKAIRDEDCGNPLDAITRLNACRSGNLCVK
jgi:uncharacterized protein DUF6184